MVKQGDIIKLQFSPQIGHEQAGYRPAVIISNNFFNRVAKMALVCPISSRNSTFPLHLHLDKRTTTQGVIMCEHVKSVDLIARPYDFVESVPDDILDEIINIVFSEIQITD